MKMELKKCSYIAPSALQTNLLEQMENALKKNAENGKKINVSNVTNGMVLNSLLKMTPALKNAIQNTPSLETPLAKLFVLKEKWKMEINVKNAQV